LIAGDVSPPEGESGRTLFDSSGGREIATGDCTADRQEEKPNEE
jgi:hypothetical protein